MRWRLVLFAVSLLAAARAGAMPQLDVPLEHWSYEYAERLALRAGLGRTFLDLKPLTRGEMAKLVDRIDAASRAGTFEPTGIESQQLDRMRAEFSEELQELGSAAPVLQRAYHVWSGDAWRLQAFWRGRERLAAGDPDLEPSGSQVDGSVALEQEPELVVPPPVLVEPELPEEPEEDASLVEPELEPVAAEFEEDETPDKSEWLEDELPEPEEAVDEPAEDEPRWEAEDDLRLADEDDDRQAAYAGAGHSNPFKDRWWEDDGAAA